MTDIKKRIVFSNETPNDQGGIIPNKSIDFSRYLQNPVVLCQHNWDAPPLGLMTDIKFEGGKWSGVPVFHNITQDSKEYGEMYEKGFMRACSIGGEAIWKSTGQKDRNGNLEYFRDENGLRLCEKFYLYEVSLVTLPSNPDAVQTQEAKFEAKIYDNSEIGSYQENLIKLSTQLTQLQTKNQTSNNMNEEEKKSESEVEESKVKETKEESTVTEEVKEEAKETKKPEEEKATEEEKEEATLKAGQKKSFWRSLFASTNAADMPKVIMDLSEEEAVPVPIHKEPGGGDPAVKVVPENEVEQEQPIGLASRLEKAKKESEAKRMEAEKACEKTEDAKIRLEECEESEKAECEKVYKAKMESSEKALKEAEEAEECYKALNDSEETEKTKEKAEDKKAEAEAEEKVKEEAEKTKNNSPIKLTAEELKAKDLKFAAKPESRMNANKFEKITFTELRSKMKNDPNCEESKAAFRALSKDSGSEKQISDYTLVLESILADPKFNTRSINHRGEIQPSILDNIRIHSNLTMDKYSAYRAGNSTRGGSTLPEILERLRSGNSEYMDFKSGEMKKMTTLTTGTDYALANPDTLAIEWLALAIFKLFPDNTWKSEIPIFGLSYSTTNAGFIWTNIAADPTVYVGTKPSTPSDYNVDDDAVALKMKPYYLQPMAFEPLVMAQLRYDKMATNWAQAFMKLDSVIDDNLLYTLASTVPATSIQKTTGTGFSIGATTDVDAFYSTWFSYIGTLAKPVLNDLIRLEQIYQKQNFDLGINKPVVVLNTTANAYLAQDSEVKNKLTEWKVIEPGRIAEFRNTSLYTRSRVAAWDQDSSAILDPSGVLPSTAVDTCLSFIPNQVGIGMGNLDVFFIQDPTTYSYRMSADVRKGIVPLRKDYKGTGLLNFGTPNV